MGLAKDFEFGWPLPPPNTLFWSATRRTGASLVDVWHVPDAATPCDPPWMRHPALAAWANTQSAPSLHGGERWIAYAWRLPWALLPGRSLEEAPIRPAGGTGSPARLTAPTAWRRWRWAKAIRWSSGPIAVAARCATISAPCVTSPFRCIRAVRSRSIFAPNMSGPSWHAGSVRTLSSNCVANSTARNGSQ